MPSSNPTDIAVSTPPAADDRRSQRRRAIVEAAARIFAEAGYDDAEMERVAAETGIAKGTLYLYFDGKRELFFACVDEGMRQLQGVLRAAAETDEDPFARIARGIRGYLTFFDANPHYAELLIQERAIFKDRKTPTYFEYRKSNLGPWRELYSQLAAAGRIRADLPVERILETVGSLLYGAMFITHFTGRSVPLDEQYKYLLDIILFGILTPPERERLSAQSGKISPVSL
jgi:AcrR family transcriptional regulator